MAHHLDTMPRTPADVRPPGGGLLPLGTCFPHSFANDACGAGIP